jgi:fido (protein-threonine AMPylation protein)
MRDKYGVDHDSYCYSGSDVLINLLNIKDPHELAEAETEFTAERYRTYESRQLSPQDFSFEHLQHLHHHLFQDLYEWAGKVRESITYKTPYLSSGGALKRLPDLNSTFSYSNTKLSRLAVA